MVELDEFSLVSRIDLLAALGFQVKSLYTQDDYNINPPGEFLTKDDIAKSSLIFTLAM